MVPHDEADRRRAALQVEERDPGGMRDRRHHPEHAGLSLLLQGRARFEHVPGTEERRREGCTDVFRFLERMVARSVAADRGGAADGGQAHHQGGVTPRSMLQSDPSGSDCNLGWAKSRMRLGRGLADVRYAPTATKFRSASKSRDGPQADQYGRPARRYTEHASSPPITIDRAAALSRNCRLVGPVEMDTIYSLRDRGGCHARSTKRHRLYG